MDIILLIGGLVLLVAGGEFMVRSAVDLALRAGLSMLVVGMTVVSFATSAPELLVSLNAALSGSVDIAFGNVIGSNIANISLVLGITAMILPITVQPRSVRQDFWFMIGVTVLLLLLLWDAALGFGDALVLVVLLVAYNIWQLRSTKQKPGQESTAALPKEQREKLMPLALTIFYGLLGIAGLHFGSEFLVEGAVNLARAWGLSERVIGLSIVSIGTSLPELAASIAASIRGKQDISLGNLLGSNIFNILGVLGITGLIHPLPVQSPALLSYDFPWLLGISFLVLLLVRMGTALHIGRWAGLALLLSYLVYLVGVF